MKEFTFYNPTRIEFGSGKENTIGAHIASAGARKVLLCYGSERIKREGLFATVSQNLADNGIEYIELGGIVMYMIYIRIVLANYCKSECRQHKQCPKSPVRSNAQNMI